MRWNLESGGRVLPTEMSTNKLCCASTEQNCPLRAKQKVVNVFYETYTSYAVNQLFEFSVGMEMSWVLTGHTIRLGPYASDINHAMERVGIYFKVTYLPGDALPQGKDRRKIVSVFMTSLLWDHKYMKGHVPVCFNALTALL